MFMIIVCFVALILIKAIMLSFIISWVMQENCCSRSKVVLLIAVH